MEFEDFVKQESAVALKKIYDILTGKTKDSIQSIVYQIMSNTASWRRDKDKAESKYPKIVSNDIIQYDEHVFVWIDETGNVGGAAPFLKSAQREMRNYADTMLLFDE